MFKIRDLKPTETTLLKDFAPPDWNTDLSFLFSFHFSQPYFYPVACELAGKVVGCANGLCHENTGWLGNIIVLPENRGQGIGQALTRRLVEFFHSQGIAHQVLTSTKLGEPVYRKLGFEITSHYVFYKRERPSAPASDPMVGIRPLQAEGSGATADLQAVFDLDQAVTGELRRPFLGRYLEEAWVHGSPAGGLDGFYLPKLANGLVIAANDAAGLALLGYKISRGALTSVVPEENEAAREFLVASGFVETARAPRMVLGAELPWQPGRVYGRGSGFCG